MVYQYLLVVGLIVAFIDAFGIGANDNANNFANAIASGSLTPLMAVLISGVFELAGAVLVGSNVAEAIRGRIINVSLFSKNPTSLQLAMVCALVGSSTFLMTATRYGAPVSTTHSIIGAVLGVGIAAYGPGVVSWDYNTGRGFAGIVASWFISIAVSGVMAALMYLVMKYTVLRYKNSFQRSLVFAPIMFGFTYAIMSLALVWKGTPKLKLDKISDNQVVTIVFVVWVVTTLATYAWVSFPLYKWHWLGQDLQIIDYILGPFAPTRPTRLDATAVEPISWATLTHAELDESFVKNEADIKEFNEKVEALEAEKKASSILKKAAEGATDVENPVDFSHSEVVPTSIVLSEVNQLKAKIAELEDKSGVNDAREIWFKQWQADYKAGSVGQKVYLVLRFIIMFGIDGRDVADATNKNRGHLTFAPRWSTKTEEMYKSLNIITSCIQAFAHGSNDVANAIGPLSTIVYVWQFNKIPGSTKSPVEIWQLAYGGFAICCGLWFYGFNIMRALGNNLTYQTPSRGFCMDVGSAITIIIASKEGFPVSTTQCITGATVGVGIANGDWRSVNWWLFAKIFLGWCFTLPCAGIVAGLLYGWTAYSPTQSHNPNSV